MTLSLDEVRNIRFPMARKPNEDGYRASSVDNFMDKLEISYAQILSELEQLRAGAGGSGESSGEADSLRGELEGTRTEIGRLTEELTALRASHSQLEAANGQLRGENQRLTNEIQQLRGQLDELRTSSDLSQTGGEQLKAENENLLRELDEVRGQLQPGPAGARRRRGIGEATQPGQRAAQIGVVTGDVRTIRSPPAPRPARPSSGWSNSPPSRPRPCSGTPRSSRSARWTRRPVRPSG